MEKELSENIREKELKKFYTPKTTSNLALNCFDLVYDKNGKIIFYNHSADASVMQNIFEPIGKQIFDIINPPHGVNELDFKQSLFNKKEKSQNLSFLIKPNPGNIPEEKFYDADIFIYKNGLVCHSLLTSIDDGNFFLRARVIPYSIRQLIGAQTKDIMIFIDDDYNILWYNINLRTFMPSGFEHKTFKLEDIFSILAWNRFSKQQNDLVRLSYSVTKNNTKWEKEFQDNFTSSKLWDSTSDLPWKVFKGSFYHSINDASGFSVLTRNIMQNSRDIAIKTQIEYPNKKFTKITFGVSFMSKDNVKDSTTNSPDANGYFLLIEINNSSNPSADIVLKRSGHYIKRININSKDKKIKSLNPIENSKIVNFSFEKIGPLFNVFANDTKIFDFFDIDPIKETNNNNIAVFASSSVKFSSFSIDSRPSKFNIKRLPSSSIDITFKNNPEKIYESSLYDNMFMGKPIKTLYLKDVTYSRSLLKKLNNRMEELNTDLQMAKAFQLSIARIPAKKNYNFTFTTVYHPANEVGGDMIDIIDIGDNKYTFLIFDVAGHGIASALVGGMALSIIRNKMRLEIPLEEILQRVNNTLIKSTKANVFITSFIGTLDTKTMEMTYIRAGHPIQYLIPPNDEHIIKLTNPNPVVGIINNTSFTSSKIKIDKGAKLITFTDGLLEARSPDGKYFGKTKLLTILNSNRNESVKIIKEKILAELTAFTGRPATRQSDDLTMLFVEF